MTDNNPDGAAFADASENQRDRLPDLPPGKKYGLRIGGWGPYSIVDDVAAPPDPSTVRGQQKEWINEALSQAENALRHRPCGWSPIRSDQ